MLPLINSWRARPVPSGRVGFRNDPPNFPFNAGEVETAVSIKRVLGSTFWPPHSISGCQNSTETPSIMTNISKNSKMVSRVQYHGCAFAKTVRNDQLCLLLGVSIFHNENKTGVATEMESCNFPEQGRKENMSRNCANMGGGGMILAPIVKSAPKHRL